MDPLDEIERWPGTHAAAVVVAGDPGPRVAAVAGPTDAVFPLASVTKVLASLAVLRVVADGRCGLDDPVGPPGATLGHLLAHASGLPLDAAVPVAAPGTRRIYSNVGIELAVAHAAHAAGQSTGALLGAGVLDPLEMASTTVLGSPATGAQGSVADLCRLAAELLFPTLLPADLVARWTSVAYPGLAGVLPGFGRQVPCDFGLGVEVKGSKHPHWTGTAWPASSFGHFGQRGGFVLVDRTAGLSVVTLGDAAFDVWAKDAWPTFTDAVRAQFGAATR